MNKDRIIKMIEMKENDIIHQLEKFEEYINNGDIESIRLLNQLLLQSIETLYELIFKTKSFVYLNGDISIKNPKYNDLNIPDINDFYDKLYKLLELLDIKFSYLLNENFRNKNDGIKIKCYQQVKNDIIHYLNMKTIVK